MNSSLNFKALSFVIVNINIVILDMQCIQRQKFISMSVKYIRTRKVIKLAKTN